MQSDISKTAGVASVTPAAINSSGTTAAFNVIPTTRPQATQTAALVNTLRQNVLPKEHATSYITGTTAGGVDFTSPDHQPAGVADPRRGGAVVHSC